ncbi:hypothetical protein G7Y89_g14664 [Cudoniella acicularis]|uniref:AMP-activated protein kinase glycogen-binding domain-containing protein n=1 Tax=Cudoniella acicularis TaxID=354080 RepID=A0A8H4VRW5_9HELO|nr:hypothetical protein G7Y89_g14664 [Cudoniella acicularis]
MNGSLKMDLKFEDAEERTKCVASMVQRDSVSSQRPTECVDRGALPKWGREKGKRVFGGKSLTSVTVLLEHPASEVYVTGTFDNWSKSEKLIKTGDVFEKNVTLPSADEKIYYKFVVDGNWVTDHLAAQENDELGNLNNVLTTENIVKHTPETAGIMSGVAPTATTAELAKDVPLEKQPLKPIGSSDLPGTFPETPAAVEKDEFSVNPLPATNGAAIHDDPELVAADKEKTEPEPTFSVAPLPAFEGGVNPVHVAPGEKIPDPNTLTANTITSGVHDDPELVAADKAKTAESEPTFSVAPLPAFDGGVNPIQLAPGEKIPDASTLTANTITSGVHDDPELVAADQKKGESEPTFSVAPLPAFEGAVNPIKVAPGEKIPDASTLTGNTVASGVHTDKESYENSGAFGTAPVLPPFVTPQSERDVNGTGVLDLPPISKNLIPESSLPIGGAGVGTFDASPTIQSVGPTSTTAQLAANVPLESSKVPEIVKESQEEAGFAPEASAIPEEVAEKSAVEKEILNEVPVALPTSEGAASKEAEEPEEKSGVTAGEAAAATGGAAVAVGGAATVYALGAASKLPESVTSKLPESVQDSINSINAQSTSQSTAKDTPEIVKESIAESGQSPEAASNEEAVLEKKAVEKELLSEVKPENSAGESAPKTELAPTTDGLKAPAPAVASQSRDVSPHTVPGSHTEIQTQPTVTSGVEATKTEKTSVPAPAAEPATPSKVKAPASATPVSTPSSSKAAESSPASSAAADKAEKKKKRGSIFGRIKAKFSHKD